MEHIIKDKVSSCYIKSIKGEIIIPADKSISHRSLILSAMASGRSTIKNLLLAQDVIDNMQSLKKIGILINKIDDNTHEVISKGFSGIESKQEINMYMGNSGTAARLFLGLLAGIRGNFIIEGDASLNKRPMQRVLDPLKLMGANIHLAGSNNLPANVIGRELSGIDYTLKVPSAQVKSAILLAGLFAKGQTKVIEEVKTRNHTENMLKALGVNILVKDYENSFEIILNNQQKPLMAYNYEVPSDFSSCAFFIIAALLSKDSDITLKNINLNPLRTGLLNVLYEMGANITIKKHKEQCLGEEVGDIRVLSSNLKAVDVSANIVASMIDEFPILSVLCACVNGKTTFKNIKELRFKESDRLKAIALNLSKLGVRVEEAEDSLTINGKEGILEGGVEIDSFYDHRIAMSFLVLGTNAKKPIVVSGCNSINTSFPNFYSICKELKFNISI